MTHRVLLHFHSEWRFLYKKLIQEAHPDLEVDVAGTFDEMAAKIAEADILFAFGAQVKRDIFGHAPKLKWVQAMGTGLDGIIDQPDLRPEVIVTATRGIHGTPLSETAVLYMLALSRQLPRSVHAQDRHEVERWPSRTLSGKTVGILGVGAISETLAPICKAFGMTVVGFSRTSRSLPGFDRMVPRDALLAAVPELDYLVLLIPSTPETRGIVSREVLRAMKPTAFLVNVARGAVVDEPALIEALQQGWIGGAGLDTFVHEPLPPDSPFWDCPNTIVTPHLAGMYEEYPYAAAAQFNHNYALFKAGRYDEMTHIEPRGP